MEQTVSKGGPTIKGIFVMSHVAALRHARGDAAIAELEKRLGRPMNYKNFEDVPLSEEIKIIECALDILTGDKVPASERHFEAGRLHFRNFVATPLGKMIFSVFPKDYKRHMLNAQNIAGHVFSGVIFKSEDLGGNKVRIMMERSDYPKEHFQGFFKEWMTYCGYEGMVGAVEREDNFFQYDAIWK